jgi:hypothetical protein
MRFVQTFRVAQSPQESCSDEKALKTAEIGHIEREDHGTPPWPRDLTAFRCAMTAARRSAARPP